MHPYWTSGFREAAPRAPVVAAPGIPDGCVAATFTSTEVAKARFGRRGFTVSTETRTGEVGFRTGTRDAFDGTTRDVLQFVGGPSGREVFTLDADLLAELASGDTFRICQGLDGGRPSCDVDARAVLEYLAEHRPALYGEPAPAMAA